MGRRGRRGGEGVRREEEGGGVGRREGKELGGKRREEKYSIHYMLIPPLSQVGTVDLTQYLRNSNLHLSSNRARRQEEEEGE